MKLKIKFKLVVNKLQYLKHSLAMNQKLHNFFCLKKILQKTNNFVILKFN